MENSAPVTKTGVLRYALMPQILPRLGKLMGSGFNHVPYFMAVVLSMLQIIPPNHPYLSAAQSRKYSVLNVLAVAANNIKPGWKNIDKLVIFAMMLAGIVMMLVQFILFFLAIFTKSAFAYNGPGLGPRGWGDFFLTPNNPQTDIAFQMLDYVFAIPNIYNADVVITPFHEGLHALFEFYSYGMILIATIIIIYHVMAVVMETARSGVPFGKRYNHAWAPVRLVLFFALLLPVAPQGLNLAQYILLNAAKYGSNVATNAWLTFDEAANTAYLGDPEQLVARPNEPNISNLITFMALARTCSWAEGRVNGRDIQPYIVFGAGAGESINVATEGLPAFADIVARSQGGTAMFRYGVKDANDFAGEAGAVYPYCGELAMPIVDQGEPGAAYIQQAYLEMLSCLWSGVSGAAFQCYAYSFEEEGRDYSYRYGTIRPNQPFPNMDPYVGETQRVQYIILMNMGFDESLDEAVTEQTDNGDWNNNPATNRGWAGAGIWFNKIAQMNGALTTAVYNQPVITKLPSVMEYVKNERLIQDGDVPQSELFQPTLSSGRMIAFETPQDRDVALILSQQFSYWGSEHSQGFFENMPAAAPTANTGNKIIDVMNLLMGTQGLFDMCKNTDVHPLAQLSALGKGLVEHSIRMFGVAAGFGLGSGFLSIIGEDNWAQAAKSITSMALSFASIGLLLGFILFYVLPFVPFIYFFFAVMTWVKGIFEAMVAMPLWALAHLHIDGEGMPGTAAEAGYFYILEIFLRPICIIIGFLGGIVIFGAMVKVLNEIFYLAISNLSGHTIDPTSTLGCFAPDGVAAGDEDATETIFKRGVIDEFFYTVIYTIIVYMIGMSCFKLVDLVPDNIMRWLGSGVSSFGAMDGDPAEGLMRNVSTGAAIAGGQLRGNAQSMGFLLSGGK